MGGWGGRAVKNVNGAVWSLAPAVWHSPELAGARGRSPRPGAPFVPRLGFVKGGGRGKNSWNSSFHLEPLLPAGVRMGERVEDFGLESLEMRIAAQHAVLFDKQIPWVPASKAVNLQDSQTPFRLECSHELVPRPPIGFPNSHLRLSPNPCFPCSAKAHCLFSRPIP